MLNCKRSDQRNSYTSHPLRQTLNSTRGRLSDFVLIFLIVVNLAYIVHLLLKRTQNREPITVPTVKVTEGADSATPSLGSNLKTFFSLMVSIDQWLGQVTPPTEQEWESLSQQEYFKKRVLNESPGCNSTTRNAGRQAFWVLHENSARQFEKSSRVFMMNLTSSKCFVRGDEGDVFFFPFKSNQPVISRLGTARVAGILALESPSLIGAPNDLLQLPLAELKTSLDFPGRKEGQQSTLVQLIKKEVPATPQSTNETPLVLPRFRRLTPALAESLVQSLNRSKMDQRGGDQERSLLIVDFRSPDDRFSSWTSELATSPIPNVEITEAEFSWLDPELPSSSIFSWTITYDQIERARFVWSLPNTYNSEQTTLIFVGRDEFDAQPFWAIMKLIPEHALGNIIWARRGEPDLVMLLSELRKQLKN